jgi:hypothetical protein
MFSMPSLIDEVHRLTQSTIESLRELPPEISDDPTAATLSLVMDFHRNVSMHVGGVSDGDGLIQQVRVVNAKFRNSIRASAPNFRPYQREFDKEKEYIMPDILFLAEEDGTASLESEPCPGWALYEEDISKMSQECVNTHVSFQIPVLRQTQGNNSGASQECALYRQEEIDQAFYRPLGRASDCAFGGCGKYSPRIHAESCRSVVQAA